MSAFLSRISAVAAVFFTVAATAVHAQIPDPLTFCVGRNNLPMSQEVSPFGFEVDFARALAVKLGVRARFVWLDPHTDSFEQAVKDNKCDAAMGAIVEPGPMAGARLLPGVILTEPYYSAGYRLIRHKNAPPVRTLSEIGEKRIAIEGESLSPFTLRRRGNRVHLLDNYESVIEAVGKGREAYGYLWGPLAAYLLRGRKDVLLVREFEPVERWNFALAVRSENDALRLALNRAIGEMVNDGSVARIFARYDVPYAKPVPSRSAQQKRDNENARDNPEELTRRGSLTPTR